MTDFTDFLLSIAEFHAASPIVFGSLLTLALLLLLWGLLLWCPAKRRQPVSPENPSTRRPIVRDLIMNPQAVIEALGYTVKIASDGLIEPGALGVVYTLTAKPLKDGRIFSARVDVRQDEKGSDDEFAAKCVMLVGSAMSGLKDDVVTWRSRVTKRDHLLDIAKALAGDGSPVAESAKPVSRTSDQIAVAVAERAVNFGSCSRNTDRSTPAEKGIPRAF